MWSFGFDGNIVSGLLQIRMKIRNYHAIRLQSSHADVVETAKCVELELVRDFPVATRFKSRHPNQGCFSG
jgi:hypothetical protein